MVGADQDGTGPRRGLPDVVAAERSEGPPDDGTPRRSIGAVQLPSGREEGGAHSRAPRDLVDPGDDVGPSGGFVSSRELEPARREDRPHAGFPVRMPRGDHEERAAPALEDALAVLPRLRLA